MHIAPAYPVLYGAVEAAMHMEGARETAMRFAEMVLPPGGVLVIDSNAFTAELNGENVIDQYTGDWPGDHAVAHAPARGGRHERHAPGNRAVHREVFMMRLIEVFDRQRRRVAVLQNAYNVRESTCSTAWAS